MQTEPRNHTITIDLHPQPARVFHGAVWKHEFVKDEKNSTISYWQASDPPPPQLQRALACMQIAAPHKDARVFFKDGRWQVSATLVMG